MSIQDEQKEQDKYKLDKYRETIEKEIEFVDIKPFSHNIISCTLRCIAEKYGKEEANRVIDDFELENMGWKKEGEE